MIPSTYMNMKAPQIKVRVLVTYLPIILGIMLSLAHPSDATSPDVGPRKCDWINEALDGLHGNQLYYGSVTAKNVKSCTGVIYSEFRRFCFVFGFFIIIPGAVLAFIGIIVCRCNKWSARIHGKRSSEAGTPRVIKYNTEISVA